MREAASSEATPMSTLVARIAAARPTLRSGAETGGEEPWTYARAVPAADMDEPVNRWFHRRMAFGTLQALRPLSPILSPNLLTLIGALLGVGSGVVFGWASYPEQEAIRGTLALLASALLVVSVVFDCADGMFARLTHQHSPFGKVLDGAADFFVVTAVWVGMTMLMDATLQSPWVWVLSSVAALLSFAQLATYDQLKGRYQEALNPSKRSALVTDEVPEGLGFFAGLYNTLYPLMVNLFLGRPLRAAASADAAKAALRPVMHTGRWLGLGLHMSLLYTCGVVLALAPEFALHYLLGGVVFVFIPIQVAARMRWQAAVSHLEDSAVASCPRLDVAALDVSQLDDESSDQFVGRRAHSG